MSEWTDERIDTLRQLLADGLSASQMGDVLGCSRNAILGKIHRLGLSCRQATAVHNPVKGIRPRRSRPPQSEPRLPRVTFVPLPELLPIPDHPVELLNLAEHHCRYPYDVDGGFLFCGRVKLADLPYCAGHCAICFNPDARR
jgi:GcrA cell cycle regulator